MNQFTSPNSFQVKVLDEYLSIMFITVINYDKYAAFSNTVRPHIVNTKNYD